MTNEREKQIIEMAKHQDSDSYFGFIEGAKWADENPDKDNVARMANRIIEDVTTPLLRRIERLREALEFYANRSHLELKLDPDTLYNYSLPGGFGPPYLISAEHGYIARKALEEDGK